MPRNISNHPEKSIQVELQDKFSSKRQPLEISVNNPPIDVYYGRSSVAVPFTWESCPGTPKVRFRENPLPPLTPPPSFLSSSTKNPTKKSSKLKLFHRFLPKLSLRKTSQPASPAASSTSSSASSRLSCSVPSSPLNYSNTRERTPRLWPGSSVENEDGIVSPVSTLCFGIGGRNSNAFKVLLAESA